MEPSLVERLLIYSVWGPLFSFENWTNGSLLSTYTWELDLYIHVNIWFQALGSILGLPSCFFGISIPTVIFLAWLWVSSLGFGLDLPSALFSSIFFRTTSVQYSKNLKCSLLYVCVCVLASQSCPTLCNSMDRGPPGSSPGKNTGVGCHSLLLSHIAGRFFTLWATREAYPPSSLISGWEDKPKHNKTTDSNLKCHWVGFRLSNTVDIQK